MSAVKKACLCPGDGSRIPLCITTLLEKTLLVLIQDIVKFHVPIFSLTYRGDLCVMVLPYILYIQ